MPRPTRRGTAVEPVLYASALVCVFLVGHVSPDALADAVGLPAWPAARALLRPSADIVAVAAARSWVGPEVPLALAEEPPPLLSLGAAPAPAPVDCMRAALASGDPWRDGPCPVVEEVSEKDLLEQWGHTPW